MRQDVFSWLADLATTAGGGAAHGDSNDGKRPRAARPTRAVVLAMACGLALALLNGSAWAYRPGGGQSFAAPPPRPAPVASPRVTTPPLAPPLAPRPRSLAPAAWSVPIVSAPQAPAEEAAAAPDPAPPYQPTRNPTVFAVLMLVGGSAALGVALVRSRQTSNAPGAGHDFGPTGVASAGAHVSPLPLMGDLIQGRYRVGRELSRDELGVMFEARHEAIDVSLRLYFLLPEHADSPEVQAQLWERVQGWAATRDPERRVIDAATTEDGRVFVVFAPASRPA